MGLHMLLKLVLAIEAFATSITPKARRPMTFSVSLHVGLSRKRTAAAGRAGVWLGAGHNWGRLGRRSCGLVRTAIKAAIARICVAVWVILFVIADLV